MALVSPPTYYDAYDPLGPVYVHRGPVVVAGPRRRRYYPRRVYGKIAANMPTEERQFEQDDFQPADCGYGGDDDGDEPQQTEQYGEEQYIDEDEPVAEGQEGEEFGEEGEMEQQSQVREKFLKDCAEHPLSQKDYKFEKLHCNSCNGHTLLRDGKPFEFAHAGACSNAKQESKKNEKNIGCNDCSGHHHHHVVIVPPPEVVKCDPEPAPACTKKSKTQPTVVKLAPPEEECEEEESSSSEEECESDEEKDAAPKPASTVVEVYLEDEAALGKKLLESQTNNKPVKAIFTKTVLSKDGKSAMKVQCCVTSSVVNTNGKMNMRLGLAPFSNVAASKPQQMISADMWTVDMNSKEKANRIQLNRDGARQFRDAGVQMEVLSDVLAHVENAVKNVKK